MCRKQSLGVVPVALYRRGVAQGAGSFVTRICTARAGHGTESSLNPPLEPIGIATTYRTRYMNTTLDPKAGFVNYPTDEGRKASAVDLGTQSPDPRRYYDREEPGLELDRMWIKSGPFAGLVQDLPEIGDYFPYELGKESFAVVRVAAGGEASKRTTTLTPTAVTRLVRSDFVHVDSNLERKVEAPEGRRMYVDRFHMIRYSTKLADPPLQKARCKRRQALSGLVPHGHRTGWRTLICPGSPGRLQSLIGSLVAIEDKWRHS